MIHLFGLFLAGAHAEEPHPAPSAVPGHGAPVENAAHGSRTGTEGGAAPLDIPRQGHAPGPSGQEHGAETEGEAHEGGGHHVLYTADDDHDGVANWRDPVTNLPGGEEAENEAYVVDAVLWHLLNFAILVGALGFALRRPIADTFRDRSTQIRHELTDSARARDEAHQRHQELLARLERIEGEVQHMQQEAVVDAEREEKKLVERAHRESARIAEQAERNLREEVTRARTELRREAVELAVQLAQATLQSRVTSADQQALARQFLNSISTPNQGENRG